MHTHTFIYIESLRQQTDDKHEQDEDDESDLSDDEYEGDEDDDDDKSVMLEDLEQSHTKYYYNKGKYIFLSFTHTHTHRNTYIRMDTFTRLLISLLIKI